MDALTSVPQTICTTKAGTSAGTTTTLTTANTQLFCLIGKAFSKAAAANEATPTLDSATGVAFVGITANNGAVIVFCRDSAGALRAVQGPVSALDVGGNFTMAAQYGAIPDTLCPFAYLVVKVGNTGSTWTLGTSNLSGATGVTYSFVDLMTLPGRVQVA